MSCIKIFIVQQIVIVNQDNSKSPTPPFVSDPPLILGDLRNLSGRKKSDVFLDPAGGGKFWAFWDLKMRLLKGKWPRNESKIAKKKSPPAGSKYVEILNSENPQNFRVSDPPLFRAKIGQKGGGVGDLGLS